jgi:hypothetical protein
MQIKTMEWGGENEMTAKQQQVLQKLQNPQEYSSYIIIVKLNNNYIL